MIFLNGSLTTMNRMLVFVIVVGMDWVGMVNLESITVDKTREGSMVRMVRMVRMPITAGFVSATNTRGGNEMTIQEADEWLAGKRSMTNLISQEPLETWLVRIAEADAAMMEQAYWIHRAWNESWKEATK